MDATAASLCMDNNIPIIVFSMAQGNNIVSAVCGENIGTVIRGSIVFTEIYQDAEDRMRKAIDVLKADFNSIRAGRANPALLDRLSIDYYGTPTPVKQLATISAPEPRLLIVQPWDKSIPPKWKRQF